MLRFKTIADLAQAYANEYNKSYRDPIKHFSAREVEEINVGPLVPLAAKHKYGISLRRPVQHIENFGYVKGD